LLLSLATNSFADDAPVAPTVKRHKSFGMIAGGIGLLIAGVGTAYGAAFATFFATTNYTVANCVPCPEPPPPYEWLGLAIPLAVVAAGGIAGGILMIVVGSHDIVPTTVALSPSGFVVRW
jgi:hypothetical protein